MKLQLGVRLLKKVCLCALIAATTWILSLLTLRPAVNKESLHSPSSLNLRRPTFKHGVVYTIGTGSLSLRSRNVTEIRHIKTDNAARRKPIIANELNELNASVINARRKVMEDSYYQLTSHKINPQNFPFLITGEQICSGRQPYLLVMIPSIHEHVDTRQAIRHTWGSSNLTWPREDASVNAKIVFLFGRGKSNERDARLQEESKKFGDIIQGDFVDAYKNLTTKMLMGLKWVNSYCSEVDYILKADEDVFVHIPNLVHALRRSVPNSKGTVYGYIIQDAKVRRQGKWSVSLKEFPLTHYPSYASGNSYVLTGNLAPRLFMTSEYMPYMSVEDAFITGVLARMIGARHIGIPGFTYWLQRSPDPCSFLKPDKVSATRVTVQKMHEIWKTLKEDWICKLH